MEQLHWNDNLAVAVSLERVRSEELISKFGIYCFTGPNHIHGYPLKILAVKEFPLLDDLNEFIKRASESGLIVKWLKGYRYGPTSDKKPLFEHMEVNSLLMMCVIIILFMTLFVCYLIAILEKKVYEKIHQQNAHSCWRYIDFMMNPNRYWLPHINFDENSFDFLN